MKSKKKILSVLTIVCMMFSMMFTGIAPALAVTPNSATFAITGATFAVGTATTTTPTSITISNVINSTGAAISVGVTNLTTSGAIVVTNVNTATTVQAINYAIDDTTDTIILAPTYLNTLPVGTNNFTVAYTDTANNVSTITSPPLTVTVNAIPAPVITNVSISSNNAKDTTKAMNGDTITLIFTSNEPVTKLSNFKINGSNPNTFTNAGNIYTATHLVDSGDLVTGQPVTFQINVKNAAGIYSLTVEQTTNGSSVTIINLVNAQVPVITTPIANQTTTIGTAITLNTTATITDTGNLSYQWYQATNTTTTGTAITGATNATYAPAVNTTGTFYYYYVVTNTNPTVTGNTTAIATSNIATVTILSANVSAITTNNILLVGDYAFDLNTPATSGYNLNNFLVAAKTAYLNSTSQKYQVYFRIGGYWYDIVSDPTMGTQIDPTKINGNGLYKYMNMQ